MIRDNLGEQYQYCSKYSSAENTSEDNKAISSLDAIYLSQKGVGAGGTIYKVTWNLTDNGKIGNAYVSKVEAEEMPEVISTEEPMKSTSEIAYYADINGDGTPDGIIYADLAVGGSGTWNSDSWSSYSYEAKTTGLKDYYISQESYTTSLGTGPVLCSTGSGEDRFYIMALSNFKATVDGTEYTTFCWYDDAYGKLDNTVSTSTNDFGMGKTNTETMIGKWNLGEAEGGYGKQNDGSYPDVWGVIQTEFANGWFLPSKSELAAFGDALGITSSNYSSKGLPNWCWSSSQFNAYGAYDAGFYGGGHRQQLCVQRRLCALECDFLIL